MKILLLALIVPAFLSLIRPGFFKMQDDLQAFRIHQMDRCFVDFQIPCRWVPDMGFQYGYPQFNFYPPGVFYLGEILHRVGFQFIDAVKILFILGFITSGLGMYLLLQSFFGKFPAMIGSLLYVYTPFKAVEVYVRGSLSEFSALGLLPFVFWASYQAIKSEKIKYFLWLTFFLGLLVLTHHLMIFIFLPILTCWVLIWLILEKKWKVLPKIILTALLAFGLSAFFTLPLIFEKQYVHTETLTSGYFDYRQHFVSLKQLFLSNYWEYGSSYFGDADTVNLSTGPVQALLGLIAVVLAALNFKKNTKLSIMVMVLAILELGVLFLIHQKSSFIWEKVNIFAWLQFPWRFLAVSVFLLSMLSASSIFFLEKYKKRLSLIVGLIAVLAVFILHLSFFKPQEWLGISDKDKFSGPFWEKQLTISIFDYLPIFAKLPPNQKAPDNPEVLDGDLKVVSYKKGSDYQVGIVEASNSVTVRLPLFDFPGMQVILDQSRIEHSNSDCRNQKYCLGLITFKVPEGKHTFKAQLTDTPIRRIGNIITILSICLAITLTFLTKKNEKDFV